MKEYLFKTDKEIKTCQECPMSEQLKIENCYYCNLLHDIAENNTKNSDCPLVEVPTHGRLIDVDKMFSMFERACCTDSLADTIAREILKGLIKNAPTVIEASTKERE